MSAATQAVKLDWETQAFRDALERYMRDSKRDIGVVMRQQVKKIVQRLMATMPPSKDRTEKATTTAKKHGEMAVRRDVGYIVKVVSQETMDNPLADQEYEFGHKGAKALGTVKTRALRSPSAIKAWHQARRRKDGRVPKINRNVTTGLRKRDLNKLDEGLTTDKLLNAYLKDVYKRVGFLASGWKAAARKLGAAVPAWINRNNAPSSATITENARGITILAQNNIPWASANRTEKRVQWAVNVQKQKLERQIDAHLVKQASRFRRS